MFQQQQQNDREMDGAFNFAYLVMKALAACLWPFMRVHSGKESLGIHALLTVFIIITFACWANTEALWIYFMAWLLAALKQKAMRIQAAKKGIIPHSRYDGYPWLASKLFPFIKTEMNLKAAEGFLGMGLGGLLTYLDPALGMLLIISGIAILFIESFNVEVRKRRVQQMRDAQLEMQQQTNDFQNGHF